jgi:hypothetical protein
MNFSLSFAPFVPLPWLIAAGAVVVALTGIGLFARQRGAGLRALALALILLALANPSLVREQRENLPNVLAVVLDNSASQRLDGREEQVKSARNQLEQQVKGLDKLDVRWIDAPKAGIQSDGTELFTALNAAMADVSPERVAGAIVITDGRVHDIPAHAQELGFKAPLHALITGKPDERDRKVTLTLSPRFGIVDKEQTIGFRIDETDSITPKRPVTVIVRRDGKEIDRTSVLPGEETRYDMPIAHAGPNIVEVEAESAGNELSLVNNRAALSIAGVREKLRVLLVSGAPHSGERTWRNLLKSDAGIDLVHFTILRPPEKQDGTPINELSLIAFPTRELFSTKIDDFDLIIFDRYNQQGILPMIYFDNIAQYIRKGGAMLIAAGPEYASTGTVYETPLAGVLKAEPSGTIIEKAYRPKVSPDGLKHPVTRALPGSGSTPPGWSEWFRLVDSTVKGGDTLMTGADDKPLLLLSREDKGRVAVLLSDQVWLWARGFEGGGPHMDLLRRLSHWLMKEPDLEEEALRLSAKGSMLTVERQTMADHVAPVTLTTPSGTSRVLTPAATGPGLWRAELATDEMGLYRAEDGTLTALTHVGAANPREFQDITSTTQTLLTLANESGGSVRRLAQERFPTLTLVDDVKRTSGEGWIGLRAPTAFTVKGLDIYPAFSGLIGLILLLGIAAAVWAREGR